MPLCHNELIFYFDMLHCRPGGEEGLHCASADRSGHEAGYPGGRLLHHGQLGRSGPQDWPQLRTRRTAGLQVLEYVGEDVLTKSHPALGAGGGGGLSQVFSSAGSIPPHPPLKRSCACVWYLQPMSSLASSPMKNENGWVHCIGNTYRFDWL